VQPCSSYRPPDDHNGRSSVLARLARIHLLFTWTCLDHLTFTHLNSLAFIANMGGAQSSLFQGMEHPARPARPARRIARPESHVYVYSTLDEKFDAVRIENSATDVHAPSDRVLDDGSETVSAAKTQEYVKKLLKDPKNQLGLSALSTNNINSILEKQSAVLHDTQTFNLAIPHEGLPVTNQRSSGRCWIFAACNTFRIAIMQKHNIQTFELSQAYLFFWDKVEKANYFLESVLANADEPLDGRLFTALNADPVGDGGQWDMIVNLVEKYASLRPVITG
jgi:bleomycin hydrolase